MAAISTPEGRKLAGTVLKDIGQALIDFDAPSRPKARATDVKCTCGLIAGSWHTASCPARDSDK